MTKLVHEILADTSVVAGEAMALRDAQVSLSYSQLTDEVRQAANYLLTLGLESSERVAVYMEKRVDIVYALYLGAERSVAPVTKPHRRIDTDMAAIL